MTSKPTVLLAACAVAVAVAGCGSSKSSSSSGQSAGNAAGTPAGALSADSKSAATGDIPDNQKYLTFHDPGYSMRYPEGWAQRGSGPNVTFQDKNNVVHVVISRGSAPTTASAAADVAKLKAANPSLKAGAPKAVALKSGPAIKVVYSTQSAPNPVTAKRVTLSVDRYVLAHNGSVATVDLGTPTGVDNIDAYRMMIASFKWR